MNESGKYDYISLLMVFGGYFTSYMSYLALGDNLTFFGIEMGLTNPVKITAWPYGNLGYVPGVPHPMINAQLFAMLGMFRIDALRQKFPYLIPLHMVLFSIHMFQEVFDVHQKEPV